MHLMAIETLALRPLEQEDDGGVVGNWHREAVVGCYGKAALAACDTKIRSPVVSDEHRGETNQPFSCNDLYSKNSSSPYLPPSRPCPDCLTPPNGALRLNGPPLIMT